MSNFKGDPNYKPYFDDGWYNSSDSLDDEPISNDVSRKRGQWFDEHYDELMDLYKSFKERGESVFGGVFFQLGSFPQFAFFIYENTLFTDADLLKAKTTQLHVAALASGTGREHRLPLLQTAKCARSPGNGGEGIRGKWSKAI